MNSDEIERCPKCNQSPLTKRVKAGEMNWICGNGHNWTSAESLNKRLADFQKQVKSKYYSPYNKP